VPQLSFLTKISKFQIMKKIILITLLFISYFISYAQTVTLLCGGPGCGSSVDPSATGVQNWTAVTAAFPQGSTITGFTWTLVGSTTQSQTTTVNNLNVQWANTANNPAHTIKVCVNFTVSGAPQTPICSNVVTQAVKFIGPITSMTVTGAGLNTSVSTGATVTVPCGSQSLTLSVPTPVTDPVSALTFTWNVPAGWSGSSTTNSINLTSNAGSSDAQIIVTARRTDGTIVQSFILNIIRPRPTNVIINGGFPNICVGQSVTLTGSSTNGTSGSWSVTSNLTITSQTSTSVNITGNANGIGNVVYTATNACNSPASSPQGYVYVGTPIISTKTVNGAPSQSVNTVFSNPVILSTGTPYNAVTFNWTTVGGVGNIYPNYANCTAYVNGTFLRVRSELSNTCGTGEAYVYYLLKQGAALFTMSTPNPATSQVAMKVDKEVAQNLLKSVVLVSDARSTVVKTYDVTGSKAKGAFNSDAIISFDVSDLPRGKYYLNIVFEGKNYSEIIILQ
jgi:hypothetical protein